MFIPGEFIKIEDDDTKTSNVDFSFFMTDKARIDVPVSHNDNSEPKKRGRPPKKQDGYVPVKDDVNNAQMPYSNQSYIDTYGETTMMLRGSIVQIDQLSGDVKTDIDSIRASKALKNKFKYLTDLTSASCALINTKVSAIREMDSNITNSHNLDLKRVKDMKIDASEQNDDRRILDLYNAFISTPVGTNGAMSNTMPNIQDMTMLSGVSNMVRADMGTTDAGYQSYVSNMTPEQSRMRLENNPNVETVVVFNEDNGSRYFDVIDKTNGQSIPNVSRPDPFVLDDCIINVGTGTAKNTNLNQMYRLVTVGSGRMSEY